MSSLCSGSGCSPPARGWTGLRSDHKHVFHVFPARAGMDRHTPRPGGSSLRVPRPLGDGPEGEPRKLVFNSLPAHAGMDRHRSAIVTGDVSGRAHLRRGAPRRGATRTARSAGAQRNRGADRRREGRSRILGGRAGMGHRAENAHADRGWRASGGGESYWEDADREAVCQGGRSSPQASSGRIRGRASARFVSRDSAAIPALSCLFSQRSAQSAARLCGEHERVPSREDVAGRRLYAGVLGHCDSSRTPDNERQCKRAADIAASGPFFRRGYPEGQSGDGSRVGRCPARSGMFFRQATPGASKPSTAVRSSIRWHAIVTSWLRGHSVAHAFSDRVTVTPSAGTSRLPLSSTARHRIVRVPGPSGFHS